MLPPSQAHGFASRVHLPLGERFPFQPGQDVSDGRICDAEDFEGKLVWSYRFILGNGPCRHKSNVLVLDFTAFNLGKPQK